MNPSQAFANRTARLVRESRTPVYSTTTEKARQDRLFQIEELACTDDFCHICSRCTNHYSEHSEAQLLAWAKRPGMLQSLLK